MVGCDGYSGNAPSIGFSFLTPCLQLVVLLGRLRRPGCDLQQGQVCHCRWVGSEMLFLLHVHGSRYKPVLVEMPAACCHAPSPVTVPIPPEP